MHPSTDVLYNVYGMTGITFWNQKEKQFLNIDNKKMKVIVVKVAHYNLWLGKDFLLITDRNVLILRKRRTIISYRIEIVVSLG